MKTIMIAISMIFFNACIGHLKSHEKTEKNSYYESLENENLQFLKDHHLSHLNDTAKWMLYTMHCDDTISEVYGRHYKTISIKNHPLGFLKLNLNYVSQKSSDTIYLLYRFLFDDSLRVEKINQNYLLTNGIAFNIKNNNIIGYVVGEGMYKFPVKGDTNNRYVSPLQPEVILFIKNNKNKLSPWFREEAKRRGILN